jgi:hypothetical protein
MMVPSAIFSLLFGNTFCLFFYRIEIAAAHKIMDGRVAAARLSDRGA